MAEAIFTKGFVNSVNEITLNYQNHLIDEQGYDEISALVKADELNDDIYDHAQREADMPLARTRELENPVRKSKFDCVLGQLQFRSVLIPPIWEENSEILFVKYERVFHASEETHNSESIDDLFSD